MQHKAMQDLITLPKVWSAGGGTVLYRLLPILYEGLRRATRANMRRERSGHTLRATALINYVFLRLVDIYQPQWRDHFLTIAAQLMRRIPGDHACRRRYLKQGGGAVALPPDELALISWGRGAYFVTLDDALKSPQNQHAGKGKALERRFFGGFSTEETAAALDVASQTELRDWSPAKAWILREIAGAI